MKLNIGKVYCNRDAMTGYFMVMAFLPGKKIKVSPLFWSHDITYQIKDKIDFKKNYKLHDSKSLNPIVKARYDAQIIRRLK